MINGDSMNQVFCVSDVQDSFGDAGEVTVIRIISPSHPCSCESMLLNYRNSCTQLLKMASSFPHINSIYKAGGDPSTLAAEGTQKVAVTRWSDIILFPIAKLSSDIRKLIKFWRVQFLGHRENCCSRNFGATKGTRGPL